MYCDRSAYILKSYKSHRKTTSIQNRTCCGFFAFWAINIFLSEMTKINLFLVITSIVTKNLNVAEIIVEYCSSINLKLIIFIQLKHSIIL